jgi:hypothetical protein
MLFQHVCPNKDSAELYRPLRGVVENSSPLGEDLRNLAVWRTVVDRAIPFMV